MTRKGFQHFVEPMSVNIGDTIKVMKIVGSVETHTIGKVARKVVDRDNIIFIADDKQSIAHIKLGRKNVPEIELIRKAKPQTMQLWENDNEFS